MRSRSRYGLDDGLHELHLGVGQTEHGDVEHLRVHDEARLDLGRVDVRPRDDHERLTVGQVEVAVVVEVSDVTERRPVLVHRVAGRSRLLRAAWCSQV
jgi:hypothetical protein